MSGRAGTLGELKYLVGTEALGGDPLCVMTLATELVFSGHFRNDTYEVVTRDTNSTRD